MASGASCGEMTSALRIVSGVASKPIRVDNWGNFLAQRIEALYDKQEHCDLTLRFPHGDLKAHSLVLHACTPFFTNLLKGKTTGPKILKMPPQISSSAMGIILKFVYTGRLEAPFSVDMLYSTAKLLKLQILIRLLEAQMNSAEAVASSGQLASPSRRGRPPFGFHRPRSAANSAYQPTNSQLAAKRSVVRATTEPAEAARPSRFELPDSDGAELRLPGLEPALLRPKAEPRAEPAPGDGGADREALFEHLRQTPVKRPAPAQQGDGAAQKRPKLEPTDSERDVTVLREYCEEQRRRALMLDEHDDPAPLQADWQDEEAEPRPASPPRTAASQSAAPDTAAPPPAVGGPHQSPAGSATPVTPRPILKLEPSPAGASGGGKKRVQFSESAQLTLTVQDMGDTSELVSELLRQHPEVLRGGQNVKVRLVTQAGSGGSPSRSEYVMVKQQQPPPAPPRRAQSAAASSSPETLDSPLSCSLCAQKGKQVHFWWADQMSKHFQDEHSDASAIDLNTLSCTACVQAGDPIDFVTVDDYFTHLRDVHDTRGVSSTGACQLCGFSANKKLQLIYHQYIKHKIRPPRFITFPKCDRCDFEAISDSEMIQHRQRRHKIGKEYKCKDCGLIFPNLSLLEGHMRTNACRHGAEEKRKFEWKCEFCGMSFSRSYNLKGHMRSVHKMSMERRRASQQLGQPAATVKQEQVAAVPASLDPSSEAESMSAVASSVAASLGLAVNGEYMELPDGIVPVEDENGMISYIALRPADGGGGGAAVSDGALLEVTQYTVPVVVSGADESVTIQVEQAGDGPGASAGETVLPDLASPPRPVSTQNIDLPRTTAPQIARTLLSVPQLQPTVAGRRRASAAGAMLASSRISVSSSEITVSDLAEPASILPHLPGEALPASQQQYGHFVMDGMSAGHVIVSELPSGQEVIVADMAHGQLYDLHQPHDLIAHPVEVADVVQQHQRQLQLEPGQLDGSDPQQLQQADSEPQSSPRLVILSQSQEANISQAQGVATSLSHHINEPLLKRGQEDDMSESLENDVSATDVEQLGQVVTYDAQHTHQVSVGEISPSGEFIGPDTPSEHVEISDISAAAAVQGVGTSDARQTDISEADTLPTEETDMYVNQLDQSGVVSVNQHDQSADLSGDQHDQSGNVSGVQHDQSADLSGDQHDQSGNVSGNQHDQSADLSGDQHDPIADVSGDQHDPIADVSGDQHDQSGNVSGDQHDQSGNVSGDQHDQSGNVSGDQHDQSGNVSGDQHDQSADLSGDQHDQSADVSGDQHDPIADVSGDQHDETADISKADVSAPELHSVVDESVAHYPPCDETVVSDEQMAVEIDESVAHYPAGEETVVSDEQMTVEIDESVAHYPAGEETVVLDEQMAVEIDESVAHYPAGEETVVSDEQMAVEIDESVAHYPAGEETVVSDEQMAVEIDESVAHYPAGEETVVSDQQAIEVGDNDSLAYQAPVEVSSDRSGVMIDPSAAQSPAPLAPGSGAPASADPSRLLLLLDEQEAAGAKVVQGAAAVCGEEEVTEESSGAASRPHQESETSAGVRPERAASRQLTAPDPGDAWDEVLPPAGAAAPRHDV